MVSSRMEYSFFRLCLNNPQLWVVGFTPVDPIVAWMVGEIEVFRREYHKYPSYNTFIEYLRDKCASQQYKLICDNLKTELDREFVQENIIKYVGEKRLEKALFEAHALLKEHKIDEAKLAILKGTELIYSQTIDYFNFKREDYVPYKAVPTGFRSFDSNLGKGLHKQNLGLIIGPKSSGKSLTMVNFGVNACVAERGVLHVSFEDSRDQLLSRYDTRFSSLKLRQKGKLHIHNFPSGQAGVADIEALVNVYKPDLVLIDYLNEIGAGRTKESRSEELGTIARGLRAISNRHECAVWTAQQAGRTSKFSDNDVTAEAAFWSYEPSQISDVCLTINQTKSEKAEGKIRFLIDRNRNGIDGVMCEFQVNYPEMLLRDCREHF